MFCRPSAWRTSGCQISVKCNVDLQTADGLFNKMVGSGLYDFNQLSAIGPEMVEGVLGFSRGDFFCVNNPEMKAFVEKFRAAYDNNYPSVFAIQGYDAIYVLKKQ